MPPGTRATVLKARHYDRAPFVAYDISLMQPAHDQAGRSHHSSTVEEHTTAVAAKNEHEVLLLKHMHAASRDGSIRGIPLSMDLSQMPNQFKPT